MNRTLFATSLTFLGTIMLPALTFGIMARDPSPSDNAQGQRAQQLLEALTTGNSNNGQAQLKRIDELVGMEPLPIKTITTFLKRERKSSNEARKKMLSAIGAAIPDSKGKFKTPGREAPLSMEEADKFDWAKALLDKSASPSDRAVIGDLLADIAAVRALARADNPIGASEALKFGFSSIGTLYRDEVGRYLRRGAPSSVPALFRALHSDQQNLRRYAKYQLERVDREAPHKALRATRAASEALAIDLFAAWSETLHREAVYVIINTVDSGSAALRKAARAALVHYASTKPPQPAPARRLSLPGGGFTKSPTKLYLDHRDLTGIELRNKLEKLTGTQPSPDASLPQLTEQLFAVLDSSKNDSATKAFEAGRAAVATGDYAAATAKFNEVLVTTPQFAKRADMAEAFLAHGKNLLAAKNFRAAAIALRKAHDLAPTGPNAKEALATAHIARARLIEAAGGDSAAELAIAHQVDPNAGGSSKGSAPMWMIFIGMGAAAGGLLLILAGAITRRRR